MLGCEIIFFGCVNDGMHVNERPVQLQLPGANPFKNLRLKVKKNINVKIVLELGDY